MTPLDQMRELEYCRNILIPFGVSFKYEDIFLADRRAETLFTKALIASILANKGYTCRKIGSIINKNPGNVCRLLNQYERRKDRMVVRFKELRPLVLMSVAGQEIKALQERITELKKLA